MYGPFADATAMSAAYAAQLDGLTVAQAEVALSTTGLSAAQQEEILTLYRGATALTEYSVQQLAAKTGLNETQLATLLSCETTDQLTYSNMMLLMSTTELSAEEKARIASLMAQTGATEGLTAATNGLNVSLGATLKLMWASPMGKLSILMTVLPIIIALVKGFLNAIKEANPSVQQMQTELADLQEQEQSLQGESEKLKDRIEELQSLKDNGTITIAEESELERLQKENELLQEQIKLYQDLEDKKQQEIRDEARDTMDDFLSHGRTYTIEGDMSGGSYESTTGLGGLLNAIDDYNEAKTAYENAIKDGDTELSSKYLSDMTAAEDSIAQFQDYLIKFRGLLDEELDADVIQKIDDALAKISSSVTNVDALMGVSDEEVNNLRSLYNEYRQIVDDMSRMNLDASQTKFGNVDLNNRQVLEWTQENLDKYKDAIESWDAKVEDFAGTISTVFGGSENFDGVEIAFTPMLQTDSGAVLLSRDTVMRYINQLMAAMDDEWTSEDLLSLDAEGIDVDGQHIKGLIADIGDTAIQTGEAMHFLGKDGAYQMSLSELETAADEAGLSLDEVIQRFGESGDAANSAGGVLDQYSQKLEKLSSDFGSLKEKQSVVEGALKDQASSGYLSVESYNKLIEASSEYADCIEYENGSLQLNADKARELTQAKYEQQLAEVELQKSVALEKWKENAAEIEALESNYDSLTETQLAHLSALQNENDGLEDTIQQFNILKGEIIGLTDAYQQWIDAQNGGESGDMYDSLKKAQKDIQEGLDSGKTGTSKYKAAVNLLIPEASKDDVAAYMESLKRYISDDSEGVTNFIHDMVTAGLMVQDGDDVQLLPDTTLDDICEKLKITPDMAKAIFGELEEYDFQFDWAEMFSDDSLDMSGISSALSEAFDDATSTASSKVSSFAQDTKNTLAEAQEAINSLSPEDLAVTIAFNDTEVTTAKKEVEGVGSAVDDTSKKQIGNLGTSTTITALNTVMTKLRAINAYVLRDKVLNVSVHQSGPSDANGSKSAVGGRTLVGELGRELVVSGDRYYTVGELGAEFVQLKAGDIVFNHRDTEKIMRGMPGARGTALAEGNAMAQNFKVSGGGHLSNLRPYASQSASGNTSVSNKIATAVSESIEDQIGKLKEELEDILDQYDFDIFMAEKQKKSAQEIIAIYRKMQETVHAQAEKYRAMGVDENSEYLRDLKKQWWDYEEKIREARKSEFEDWLNDSKFAIEAMEHDKSGADRIVDSWRTILKSINAEIDYYTSQGYDTASDEIQDLLKEMWDAEDEIKDILDSVLDDVMERIDSIQDLFKTLRDAADEYAETQYLSLDAYQKIVEMGVEYMSYLRDENGNLKINRQRIEDVLAAKTQQMAVEAALNYVRRIGIALSNNETAELDRLLHATEETSNATWGLVYANLAFLKLTDEQRAAARKNINNLRALADNVSANISKSLAAEDGTDNIKSAGDALEDILELTKDLVKHEKDQLIEALDDQLDRYKEIIDKKKESLALTQSELEYNKDIEDRTKEISDLQSRIYALGLDDSREAAIERAKLLKELSEKQEALEEKQRDHAYDLQVDSLDKQQEAFEKMVDDRKSEIENETSSEQKLYDLAIKKIQDEWDTLEDQLLAWNTEYGRSLNKEVIESWEAAREAAERYGSFVEAMNATGNGNDEDKTASDIVGESKVYEESERIQRIAEQMQRNSIAWFGASDTERARLASENEAMSRELEQYTNSGIYKSGGTWYRSDGSTLYQLSDQELDATLAAAMKQNSIAWFTASDSERARLAAKNEELAGYSRSGFTKRGGSWYDANGNVLYTISSNEKEAIAKNIVSIMKSNSRAWSGASAAEQKRLADENERYAKTLEGLLGATLTKENGTWFINGRPLYDVYHKGGVVGGGDKSSRERFAVLEKGEMVLAEKHFKALDQMIEMSKFVMSRASEIGTTFSGMNPFDLKKQANERINGIMQARTERSSDQVIQVDASLSVSGVVDEQVLEVIKRHPRAVAEEISKQFV